MFLTGKSKVKTMTVFKKQNTYRFKAQVINGNNRDDFLCDNFKFNSRTPKIPFRQSNYRYNRQISASYNQSRSRTVTQF